MDTHYGHNHGVLDLAAYSKDRVLTCGEDYQAIFWKIYVDTQMVYRNTKHDTNHICVLNDEHYLTASSDSVINLWTMKKKRPIYILENAHQSYNPKRQLGQNQWVTSICSMYNTDLFCSSSVDSPLNLYKFNKEDKSLELKSQLGRKENAEGQKWVQGVVSKVRFSQSKRLSKNGLMIFSEADEQKMGRWVVSKPQNKHGLSIVKFSYL